jgi:alpha-glucosidase (family GH31 glycosyl hydrolase)
MQWHRAPAWGGYSWDHSRYPSPTDALMQLHALGVATGANFHDDDGVTLADNPDLFAAFAAAVGLSPDANAASFDIANKTYADALQRIIMDPLIAGGIDLAWTDFQQGFPGVTEVRGLVPTALLNHYRFYNFTTAPGTRGTYHSRYAGRGDHRHASHFGGDVLQNWDSLRFLIFFTASAANAPVCFWGHEMMRDGGGIDDNSELFTRVNQYGAWSPIFTSWGNVNSNNDWWMMSEPHLSAVRLQLVNRQRLLPYRYSASAVAHRTGRCFVRSLYFDYAEEPLAYESDGQFLLGFDIVVAPAFSPVAPPLTGTVDVSVWLPPTESGAWIDFASPSSPPFAAGSVFTYAADLFTVPAFVKAGAVIPMLPRRLANVTGIAGQQYSALEFNVFPGADRGSTTVYEDDGVTTDYLQGVFAETAFSYEPDAAHPGCTSYIVSTNGTYTGIVTAGRLYSVFVLASTAPKSASVDGSPLPQASADGTPGSWFYSPTGDVHAYLSPAAAPLAPASLSICY